MSDLLVGDKLYVKLITVHRRTAQPVEIGSAQPQQADTADSQPPKQAKSAPGRRGAQQVQWESSNEKIATVQGDGHGATITAVTPGDATIEASFEVDLGNGVQSERAGYVVTVLQQYAKTGAWLEPGAPQ